MVPFVVIMAYQVSRKLSPPCVEVVADFPRSVQVRLGVEVGVTAPSSSKITAK